MVPPITADDGTLEIPNRLIPSYRTRQYLYSVLAAAGLALVAFGIVEDGQLSVILTVVGAILGIVPNAAIATLNVPHEPR